MFDDLGELEHVFGMLDESCKYPPEDGLEWITAKNSEFEKRAARLADALAEIERKHGVPVGASYQSEIVSSLRDMLRDCDSSIYLRPMLNDLKLLLLKAMVIGVELKSDGLVLLADKGKAFTEHSPRGHDALGEVLLVILKTHGKKTPAKTVWQILKNLARGHSVIQEVTDESVWWKSSKGEKETSFRTVEKRLSELRKEI
jgi:hypothetical protein